MKRKGKRRFSKPSPSATRPTSPLARNTYVAIFSVKADGTVVTENAAKQGLPEKPASYREADRALALAAKKREKREALCNVRHMRWAS